MQRRKVIHLNPIEHETLARLYVEKRIATDRFMSHHRELLEITADFNGLSGRNERHEDILHYMQTRRRRKGQWPTLNGTHLRLPVVLGRLIDPEHADVLRRLYIEFGVGAERFVQDRTLAVELERRFFMETGVRKRGYILATAMVELRKEGNLPKLPPNGGFGDFDAAEKA